jgi:hypothetical protein
MTMDWSLLIGLLAFIAIGGADAYHMSLLVARTKTEFLAGQPALRVTNLSAMNAGHVLTLTPELENVGRGVAYDCVLQLGGWEGNFSVKAIHPRGPRYRKHAVSIVLGPDTPIRTKSLSRSYLRLSYRDRWGLIYECWYPVDQIKNAAASLYDIQIDLSHPELTEPTPSFRTMRRLLQSHTSDD